VSRQAGRRRPDLSRGAPYPEQVDRDEIATDRMLAGLAAHVLRAVEPLYRARLARQATAILALEEDLQHVDEAALLAEALALRGPLLREGHAPHLVTRAFALVREASARHLGLRHHKVQLMGGLALLDGRLIEMATGEGKTITAMLAAATAGLAGRPVHVITVNEYLAARDAERLGSVYAALGLSVGLVRGGQAAAERRAAYACDVTYCTAKDLVFDYLRDRIALRGRRSGVRFALERALRGEMAAPALLLRGLRFAIVDEADSVLIDEARTPLVISHATAESAVGAEVAQQALDIGRQLLSEADFRLSEKERRAQLTEAGRQKVRRLAAGLAGIWTSARGQQELACLALAALYLFRRDEHYIVADNKVQIVDEATGRAMPDRSWEHGLHQIIEAKESLPLTGGQGTLAQITFQRFFGRYLALSGMTGTGAEAAAEIRAIYHLDLVRIPRHRPERREHLGIRMASGEMAKWNQVVGRVGELQAAGRPVLIGTRSVGASERVSEILTAAGLSHVVLNARQDSQEADLISQAGFVGQVTVATNMAGRGTDIILGEGVSQLGGLHVILTEFHESRRIDRQFYGRAGRQGDPGSSEAIVALDDDLFSKWIPGFWAEALHRIMPARAAYVLRYVAQSRAERTHSRSRRDALLRDRQSERVLAFAGRGE
jgi:preprotein translocase subunit SecA